MKRYLSALSMAIGCQLLAITYCHAQIGTWTKLTNNAPDANMGVMLLLTNGTVMVHDTVGGTYGTGWDLLTPNATGSYINGTWSTLAAMHYDRLFFSSQVLPSGEVYVAGGEYGPGGTHGEVYNPVTNTWTVCGNIPSGWNIYDAPSELLYTGNILEGPEIGANGGQPCKSILQLSPTTLNYTTENEEPQNHDEAQWLKLPDSSVLIVGMPYPNNPAQDSSCRFLPKTNTWLLDAQTPNNIYDQYGFESGPGLLLPNGKAIFFGASKYNAIYTPTGHATVGSWVAAANFPTIRGTQMAQPDAPGVMMVNGHILLAVSPLGTRTNDFQSPIYFLEYDYTTNTFTQVTSPIPGTDVGGGDSIASEAASCFLMNFLELPDGTVLASIDQEGRTLSTEYWVYTPGSGPIPQGKPTINSILPDGCPNYKITGKLFNGISEGSAYGDDWQNATNYPLVRLTNGTDVYYAKTTNWNRVGAVQTDSLEDTAVFALPALPSGAYSLVVVANGFASNPILFKVLGISSIASTNISCTTPVGTASVTASGGLSPLTYTWNPGGNTNASASNLSAGTYTVNVTDNNGCTVTASAIITGGGTISVLAQVTANVTCNGGNTGSASSSASGGTLPYTFNWNNGGTNATVSGLSAGTYTVTGHDSCGSSGTASVVITQPAAMSISIASQTNISCAGSSSGSATAGAATGGTSPYTYSWSSGLGTNLAVSNLSAGTYTISATDSHGCTASASAAITQAASSIGISIATVTNVICSGGTGNVTASTATGGTSPYTYSWSNGGGTSVTSLNVSAGTYTITVTDNHGCTATASAVITQPATFGLSINTVVNVLCYGGTGNITANAATGGTSPYIYSWSAGGGTNLSAIAGAGTYTITATDNNGCTATTSGVITQPAQLGITIASQTNISCNTVGSATANAATGGTSPYVYSWSGGGGTALTASNLSAGTYTITGTDNNNCTAVSSVTITQPGTMIGISIASQTNIVCNGGNSGSITANAATGGTSPYTYLWTSAGGTGLTASNLVEGSYTITATDNNGCSASASVIITQPNSLTLSSSIITNVGCNGSNNGSASASQSGGTSPYNYLWSDAASQTSATAIALSAGTYTVTVSDSCGGSATASVIITQPTPISLAADSINATTGNCNGSAWAVVSGGTAPYSYFWTGGLTTDTISGLCAAGYCCTITDANGCMDSVCVVINSVTGTKQITGDNGLLTIYPNPNNGKFTLQIANGKLLMVNDKIEIYNILGENIYSQFTIHNSQFAIDLSSQPDGVYLYRVVKQDGSLIGSGKIIIQK